MIKQILIQQCILNNRIGLSQACLGKMKKKKNILFHKLLQDFINSNCIYIFLCKRNYEACIISSFNFHAIICDFK